MASFNEVPLAALNTFVVVTNGAERSTICFVGNEWKTTLASEVWNFFELPLVEREEAGTCEVCFVAEYAIEFGWVTQQIRGW